MELIKLAAVFAIVVILTNIKIPFHGTKKKMDLSVSIFAGCLSAAMLYNIIPLRVIQLALETITSWETLSICLITYLITFLQRMMEHNQHLYQAQQSLSAIFNSRRVNCTLAPMLVGLLPSPAAAFIAGDMVNSSCGDYLDVEDQAFLTSYYRHIPESCLPTYSSIILALSLAGVSAGSFLAGMALPVIILFLLGWVFYVRKVPKSTGSQKQPHIGRECLKLFKSLWAIGLVVLLIVALGTPTWLAVLISVVLYFFINRLRPTDVAPYVRTSFEWNIMCNTVVVMFFKNIISESKVITLLPDVFGQLPLPPALIFALIFTFGTIIAGSNAIVAMCIPMAFAAIPDGGMPLMVLLMCSSYIAMQVAPVHICLTLIAEHFHVSLSSIIKRTIPILLFFGVFLIGYYYLLLQIPGI